MSTQVKLISNGQAVRVKTVKDTAFSQTGSRVTNCHEISFGAAMASMTIDSVKIGPVLVPLTHRCTVGPHDELRFPVGSLNICLA